MAKGVRGTHIGIVGKELINRIEASGTDDTPWVDQFLTFCLSITDENAAAGTRICPARHPETR
jgi:hypothetical protein